MVWACLMGLVSCDPGQDPVESDMGYAYFPLVVGQYRIYEIDSSYYRANILTPVNYLLRIKTVKSNVNSEGGNTFTLSLEKRTSTSNPWAPLATYSARISDNKVVVAEGNVSFVKLLLPPEQGITWNGNAFNSLGGKDSCNDKPCELYTYTSVGERFTLSSTMDFEKAILIEQRNSVDAIVGDDVRKEVYAEGVGLVYKESKRIEYCTEATRNCVGKKFIDNGVNYKLTIIAYGQE